jgi:uncharacterized hydrophobic protein (TIGR00271 family)
MTDYISSALFVHTKDTEYLCEMLRSNPGGVNITPVEFEVLMQNPQAMLEDIDHIVVSGSMSVIKTILNLAATYGFSVGLVPTGRQKNLTRCYDLPKNDAAAIDLALQKEAQVIDLILCNGEVLLFKATVGRIPVLDAPGELRRLSILVEAFKNFFKLKLHRFDFTTASEKRIKTAACGCMIIQHHTASLASRLASDDSSFTDAMISMVVSAPISILQYLGFLAQLLKPSGWRKRLPDTIGYIKSQQIDIASETEMDVFIDGERATQTPLHCIILPQAVRIKVGDGLKKRISRDPAQERINVNNLPKGKELVKAQKKKNIPFFSYASEERFKDLFTSLRDDARIDGIYLTLMILSTMLATLGLYLDSASVIIGAMLLAPLMAPIVSLSMGILRNDERMLKNSLAKIFVGMIIALLASALITLLFPHKPITGEMQARLNPTVLDLAVAVISGIAAAYSKSFKEIIQSLAGVAIAVALVPPLAVAGIGIGRLDLQFFYHAFLLFTTNLIGIAIAANFTFLALGYSPAIRGKRNLGIVLLLYALITIPLYLSYDRIVEKIVYEKRWQKERFLVNGKYIIVQKADIGQKMDKSVIVMEILARELLTREDLNEFRKKIQTNFDKKLIIRLKTIYIP